MSLCEYSIYFDFKYKSFIYFKAKGDRKFFLNGVLALNPQKFYYRVDGGCSTEEA